MATEQPRSWRWDPGAQCPKRGPALSHITDGRVNPDGSCIYCGAKPGEATLERPRKSRVCKGFGCIEFTTSLYYDFCDPCWQLVRQHDTSHLMEGHSQVISMCPRC